MSVYVFLLAALGVWRITHLLNAEDGPWDLLARLREGLGDGFWGSLLDCFYCLSLWIAAPFALLGDGWRERLLLWPALSGAAILLERLTARPGAGVAPAAYFEDEEDDDGMLRQAEDGGRDGRQGPPAL